MTKLIKNIIFDVFSVLLDCDYQEALSEKYGHRQIQTLCNNVFYSDTWNALDRGLIIEEVAVDCFAKNLNCSQDDIISLISTVRHAIKVIPEGLAILKQARLYNYQLYCLSNMPIRTFEYVSNKYDFFSSFNGIIISGYLKLQKPEPEIYKYLLDNFSLNHEQTVFIDDNRENINVANKMGIKSFIFDRSVESINLIECALFPKNTLLKPNVKSYELT